MFSDPSAVINQFELTEGMMVADFGAGSGAYTFALAEKVGPRGKVYAVDVQNNLLERLTREARARHLGNISIVWGDVEQVGGSKLRDGLADLVLVANILSLCDAKYTLLLEAKRVLKPGGSLVVIDWNGKIKIDELKQVAEQAELHLLKEFAAGDEHFGLIFTKT